MFALNVNWYSTYSVYVWKAQSNDQDLTVVLFCFCFLSVPSICAKKKKKYQLKSFDHGLLVTELLLLANVNCSFCNLSGNNVFFFFFLFFYFFLSLFSSKIILSISNVAPHWIQLICFFFFSSHFNDFYLRKEGHTALTLVLSNQQWNSDFSVKRNVIYNWNWPNKKQFNCWASILMMTLFHLKWNLKQLAKFMSHIRIYKRTYRSV